MNKLLHVMAEDLSIKKYENEKMDSFSYRVCYSGIALWMLKLATSYVNGKIGISKNMQTTRTDQILSEYQRYFGLNSSFFFDGKNSFSHHIRNVYEETGYLACDERNYCVISNHERTVDFENGYLFFGLPQTEFKMSGVGIYVCDALNKAEWNEVMLRDIMPVNDYLDLQFNLLDFGERDFNRDELEFFDPTLQKPPSNSWTNELTVENTIARTSDKMMYYKTIREGDGGLIFKEIDVATNRDKLIGQEIRRLYCALKAKYGSPTIAWFNTIDSNHTEIRLSAQLPNREYFYLLLMAWPEQNAFDRTRFICKNENLLIAEKMLTNIGVKIRR